MWQPKEKDATVNVLFNGKEQKELKKVKLVEGDDAIVIEVRLSGQEKEKDLYIWDFRGRSIMYLSNLEHKNNSTNGWR